MRQVKHPYIHGATIEYPRILEPPAGLDLGITGITILLVSNILGHSKSSTTLDIYDHLIPIMQEEAARIMDEIITPILVDNGEKIEVEIPK